MSGDECPQGGDIKNDCDGCAYSAEYHYDKTTGECRLRPEVEKELNYVVLPEDA